MELEMAKYNSYSKTAIWCLTCTGLWPKGHYLLKKIRSFISLFSITTIMMTAINFSFQNAGNVQLMTKGIGTTVSFSSIFSKIVMVLYHQDDFVYLSEHLTTRFKRDLEQKENRRDLLFNVHIFTKFANTHVVSVAFAMAMYSIGPMLALYKHGKYVRTFPCLYPFHYEPGDVLHWMIYGLEVSGTILIWFITIGVDCGFCLYALEFCGEFKVLGRKFREMRMANDYKDKLIDCIERHHLIINAKNRLEDAFGIMAIWLALSGAFSLCSLLFQIREIMENHGSYLKIAHLCSHLLAKYLQIFMYAWYGNLIAEESQSFLYSMYCSHWTDACDKRFKNDILIVLAQEPLILVAKGCMNIQLDMFVKIVKTAMSYFFLLQTISSDEE